MARYPGKCEREWHARTRECVRLEIARQRVDACRGWAGARRWIMAKESVAGLLKAPFVFARRCVSRGRRKIAKNAVVSTCEGSREPEAEIANV